MIVKPPRVRTITPSGSRTRVSGAGGGRSNRPQGPGDRTGDLQGGARSGTHGGSGDSGGHGGSGDSGGHGGAVNRFSTQQNGITNSFFFYLAFIAFWKRALHM